ncbi:MAG: rhomboid family intramembrane serine protease [Cytophagaceae bacterium]
MTSLLDEFKYSFKKRDNGLMQIIVINIAVFVVMGILKVFSFMAQDMRVFDFIMRQMALSSNIMTAVTKPWTIFTYFFTHSLSSIFHILFNMLFLYWFGRLIMEYLGHRRLVNLYIVGGVVAGLLFIALYNILPVFADAAPHAKLIGASGSVYAIVVAAATLLPEYRFHLIFLGPVKIAYIAGFFIFISFLGMAGENAGGNIAHLGGALIGFLYIKQLKKGTDLGKPVSIVANWIQKLFRPRHLKVSYRNNTSKSRSKVPDEQEIDAILDKISVSGYESLTQLEKEKLFKASQQNK